MKSEKKEYYLGLDIGTDSVGYAATNELYDLMKFKGEPVWGVTTFEAASLAEERRSFRTARRRLDRKQQRTQLISEIFAPEICKIDSNFFIRRKESALFAEDTSYGVRLFEGGDINDREYHKKYPTIHHLIYDLMKSDEPRDVRLVYLACAWLVANRGHFLIEASADKVNDFNIPYEGFREYLIQDCECGMPWDEDISAEVIQNIMQADTGVSGKKNLFKDQVYHGKKPTNKTENDYPFKRDSIVTLLSGGKVSPKELFDNDDYSEIDSVSLNMDEDNFERILAELGDDAGLLRAMRALYDCAVLNITLHGNHCISAAKIAVYDQHAKDLKYLKQFIRKYKKEQYSKIFRMQNEDNYVSYSHNLKNCADCKNVKKTTKDKFSDFLLKVVKDISVEDTDRELYEDMLNRLAQRTFLPKQKDSDNRVIPQQLYRYELTEILNHAGKYLPFLCDVGSDGVSNAEKIVSVFDFRIPYYVGPLNSQSSFAWLVRKTGKIYPWNFEQMVDLDASEQMFIRRMTNTCTYLPGEDVLPYCSLLYSRFMVLNEINNLKVNQHSIPVAVKQEIYTNLFSSGKKITKKKIEEYLKSRGYMNPDDELSGLDGTANASLKTYKSFQRMLESRILTEEQAEEIINHAAYSEDKNRMEKWLIKTYPSLSEQDRKYILHLNLKEFGRLSKKFLCEIIGYKKETGEAFSIMEALWETNENLMQLLSDRYSFREEVDAFSAAYYANPENKKTLSERLSDMYVSNAVKRPIIRTLDITGDVVKAMGHAPKKIFVEMARGSSPAQRGKRTVSRKQQIIELYRNIRNEETPRLLKELEAMGENADNRLQSDRLFLYYTQLGRCMYTNEPIDLSRLATNVYDIDHIYPQSKVQDDSILNNKVLVLSSANGAKGDRYPVDEDIRRKMKGFWSYLLDNKLITEEKYRRLTRVTRFTDEELHQFINRQLVETRQSTKVVAQLLKEHYPDTEIVYVKAGMVSEFRNEFDMLKCRSVNDLHHAKDAYLNIVVGNVYYEMFTKRWFDTDQKYNISVKKIFKEPRQAYGNPVWQGEKDLAKTREILKKNAVHFTRFTFIRKGGLFDQNPIKAGENLVPRKIGLKTEKYGGYNKATASCYILASYKIKGKKDLIFVPIECSYYMQILKDGDFAEKYVTEVISEINGNKKIDDVQILLNGRTIKINTILSLDGTLVTIRGKSNKGANLIVGLNMPLILGKEMEGYIKNLERYQKKKKENSKIKLNAEYDHITKEKNLALYEILKCKLNSAVFLKCPGNFGSIMENGTEPFERLETEKQAELLLNIIAWFENAPNCNLVEIGGKSKSGAKVPSAKLSALSKNYKDIHIVDVSASGLFVSHGENLLNLL